MILIDRDKQASGFMCWVHGWISTFMPYPSNYGSLTLMDVIDATPYELVDHILDSMDSNMRPKEFGRAWGITTILKRDEFDLTKQKDRENYFHYTNLTAYWLDGREKVVA